MTTNDKLQAIDDILSRGVGEFVDPDGKFRAKLVAKVQGEYDDDIVIKLGVDPTRPDLHIGHAIVIRKLRQLQDLGCKVIFLIGDFTSLIGDPTGKSKVRPELSLKEIEANMQTYLEQMTKILRTDPEVFSWIRNSDWFTGVTDIALDPEKKVKLNFKKGSQSIEVPLDPNSFPAKALVFERTRMQREHGAAISVVTLRTFMATLRKLTHSTLIQRDMFQERINSGTELYMHEMMYPVLQGLDSSVLARIYGSCDLEVGGTDQHFNMLMGRDVMKMNNQDPQAVISFELLEGLDGKEKMSKSLDNYIGIADEPADMYGKVMSLPDQLIPRYFELATFMPLDNVNDLRAKLDSGELHPRDAKMQLARQIVVIYHGEDAATSAEQAFVNTFQKGEIPDDMPTVTAASGDRLVDVLLTAELVSSKSAFRRLITEGAIRDLESDTKITDQNFAIEKPLTLKVGKRRFLKISLS